MDLRQRIKDANDLPLTPVECPTWDCTIYVRTMKGSERDDFEHFASKATRKKDNRGLKLELVMLTACDETGALLFLPEDREWLPTKSAVELDRIANASLAANGFSDKDVEQLEKN